MRYWDFEILVEFKSGTVSKFGYYLMIATPERGSPGVVVVGASSDRRFADRGGIDMRDDESPNYQVRTARKWPDMSLGITFIPGVADELMRHAFDLRLDCLWPWWGAEK